MAISVEYEHSLGEKHEGRDALVKEGWIRITRRLTRPSHPEVTQVLEGQVLRTPELTDTERGALSAAHHAAVQCELPETTSYNIGNVVLLEQDGTQAPASDIVHPNIIFLPDYPAAEYAFEAIVPPVRSQ